MRNCYLVGLNDLDGAQTYVQDVQAKYMNDLISIGVAGTLETVQDFLIKLGIKPIMHTLYNVILRIARNLLETRENIKIESHPFYHIIYD